MAKRIVDEVCQEIRSIASRAIFIQNIKRHGFNWDLTWAAMDTIEDTELAINSFLSGKSNNDQGSEYLRVYGLFQAIFMQQDAVRNLAEGLNSPKINISTDPAASEVREMRNKYFGHHKYKRNGITTYHGISRMTVGSSFITAWTYPNFSTEDINLKEAIEVNKKYVSKSLKDILENMKKKKIDYAAKIKDKLSEDRQTYAFEKIFSWVYGDTADRCVMTGAGLRIIRSSINEVEAGLKARYENLAGIGDLERTIEKSRYVLDTLDRLFKENPNGTKGDFHTEVYVEALDHAFSELIDICTEANSEFKQENSRTQ